MIWSYF